MIVLEQDSDPDFTRPFDLRDRGLLLADGVFDTSMAVDGAVVFREAHIARLLKDAAAIGIEIARERIDPAIEAALAGAGFGSLRVTVTRGAGARGLAPTGVGRPTVLASFSPGDPKRVFAPITVTATSIRRNETSPSSKHKTLAYLDSVLAAREAAAAGADEALFLNTEGRLACCAAGNIFVLAGRMLTTPAIGEGVLAGVIRDWVLSNAARAGLDAHEGTITLEQAAFADAAFVTSSLRLIAPASGVTSARATARPAAFTALMQLLVEDLTAAGFAPPFDAPEG